MKKLMTIAGLFAVLAAMTGCLTRASAHTKKTVYSDGRVVYESYTSIIGTGDKASEVAGDGMFADGTEEDLGAGFKKGSANQQSTGIKETLEGVGALIGPIAQLAAASQGVPVKTAAQEGGGGEISDSRLAIGDSGGESGERETAQTEYSTDGYGGSPGAAGEGVYGRPSCARCRAYKTAHPEAALINIDEAENKAAMWKALRDRKFTGPGVDLPVEVTAAGYETGAK